MNKQKIIIWTLLSATIFTVSSSFAAGLTNNLCGFYLGIEGGAAKTLTTNVEPDWSVSTVHTWYAVNGSYDTDFGTAPSFGAKLGYAINKNIAFDLAYNRRGNFNFENGFTAPPGTIATAPLGEIYKYNDINSNAFTFNATLFPSISSEKFKPFVSAGIGVSINKLGSLNNFNIIDANPAQPVPLNYNVQLDGANKTSFTWQIGAGLDYSIIEHLDFGLGYRFVDLGKFTTGTHFTESVAGTDSTVKPYIINHLNVNEFYARLNYYF